MVSSDDFIKLKQMEKDICALCIVRCFGDAGAVECLIFQQIENGCRRLLKNFFRNEQVCEKKPETSEAVCSLQKAGKVSVNKDGVIFDAAMAGSRIFADAYFNKWPYSDVEDWQQQDEKEWMLVKGYPEAANIKEFFLKIKSMLDNNEPAKAIKTVYDDFVQIYQLEGLL